MLYMIYIEHCSSYLKKHLSTQTDHLSKLQLLRDEGRLSIAGMLSTIDSNSSPKLGFFGSIIIAKFESLDAAKAWFKKDPYRIKDIYKKITIKPYIRIL